MWISAIRLRVKTKDASDAGTDHLVTAEIVRDGVSVRTLRLDYPTEDDLERGAQRNYDYFGPSRLDWINDETPQLPDGVGQDPMPYPPYGIEFSNGLQGHLKVRLRIHGDDMWIKDNVDLYIQEFRQKATSFDTWAWQADTSWHYVATWSADKQMSDDSDEGVEILNLNFT